MDSITPVTQNSSPEDILEGALEDHVRSLRAKILHGLTVYPFVSPTMLHVLLGTATPATVWRPILEGLVNEGLVKETRVTLATPTERQQQYTILHLCDNPYTFNAVD